MWRLNGCPCCGGDLYQQPVTIAGVHVDNEWLCLQCCRTITLGDTPAPYSKHSQRRGVAQESVLRKG